MRSTAAEPALDNEVVILAVEIYQRLTVENTTSATYSGGSYPQLFFLRVISSAPSSAHLSLLPPFPTTLPYHQSITVSRLSP